MHVLNTHQRNLDLPAEKVGALIDTLASPHDRLWPNHLWPRMEFDGPLAVGAKGGHGPIRYHIVEYCPCVSINTTDFASSVTYRFARSS